MFHDICHLALREGAALVSALLPTAPLLALLRPATSAAKNIVLVHAAVIDEAAKKSLHK
jgi:hypothetical protein